MTRPSIRLSAPLYESIRGDVKRNEQKGIKTTINALAEHYTTTGRAVVVYPSAEYQELTPDPGQPLVTHPSRRK